MSRLLGKVAVITGGTRGLGLATARAFLAEGADVVVGSRSPASVERAVTSLGASERASGLLCDVADLAQVEALCAHAEARFGRLDVWVNNAGLSAPYGPTAAVPPDAFERVVRTNVLGTYHGSIVALHRFLPRHQGKLINILGRGDRQPVPLQNAYAASKAWARHFTLALAREERASGVGIFAFNPGLMFTDLMGETEAVAGYEARLRPLATVMRLWGRPPEEPAQRLVWLASSATDGKTGLDLRVLTPAAMVGGVLRAAGRRLARRPEPLFALHTRTVPPAGRSSSSGSTSGR